MKTLRMFSGFQLINCLMKGFKLNSRNVFVAMGGGCPVIHPNPVSAHIVLG